MKIEGKEYRTIWFDEKSQTVKIIDQTKLPHQFVIKDLKTVKDAINAIKVMEVRGAPLIGATAAYGLVLAIFENNDQLIEIIQNVEVNQERVFESEFILKVGRKKITVNLSCSPVFDDSDTFSGIVVAFDDLSKINKVKSTFKKYVSKNIVDKLLESEDSLNLGGTESDVTILFSDIRGFTSMSEKLSPSEIVKLLNKYFKSYII